MEITLLIMEKLQNCVFEFLWEPCLELWQSLIVISTHGNLRRKSHTTHHRKWLLKLLAYCQILVHWSCKLLKICMYIKEIKYCLKLYDDRALEHRQRHTQKSKYTIIVKNQLFVLQQDYCKTRKKTKKWNIKPGPNTKHKDTVITKTMNLTTNTLP